MENTAYQSRKADDLQQRLDAARSKVHHNELVTDTYPAPSTTSHQQQHLLALLLTCLLVHAYNEQIARVKLQVHQLSEHEMKRAIAGPSKTFDLDIPESVGLSAPLPMPSSARLMDVDIGRLRKRRL